MKSSLLKSSVLTLTLIVSTFASFIGKVSSYAQTQCYAQSLHYRLQKLM